MKEKYGDEVRSSPGLLLRDILSPDIEQMVVTYMFILSENRIHDLRFSSQGVSNQIEK